jgi:AcrR family transcriptional regulator
MKSDVTEAAPKRAYRQTARAEAAEQTATRIVSAFADLLRDEWFDEVTLERVAQAAGVSVQTVVRRFGGKEGLLYAVREHLERDINQRRTVAPGDIAAAVNVLVDDYEAVGDLVLRGLAQEERFPALKPLTDYGRACHRAWLAEHFAPFLAAADGRVPEARLDALVVATDVYVWKLVRRDMGRTPEELRIVMHNLIRGALVAAE